MVDVSKIEGPSGPPESSGKKGESVDADKFKEAMRRRVTEVSQVDPDEKKKRKQQQEVEEESEVPAQGPTTPPEQVTPFSLEQEQKKISPLEMQGGGPGISPTESAQPTTPPQTNLFAVPSPSEMTDDSGFLEEESFIENVPASQQPPQEMPPSTPPPQAAAPPPPPQPPELAVGPPESAQGQMGGSPQGQKQQEPLALGPPPEKQQPVAGLGAPLTPPQQETAPPPQKGTTAAELEGTVLKPTEETAAFFEQMGGKGGQEGEGQKKTPQQIAQEEAALQGGIGTAPPAPFTEEGKTEEKKGVEKTGGEPGMAPAMSSAETPAPAALPPPPPPLPSYANMPPQVMELFDRMVGVMTVMNLSGMTETVITLNAPQFASSVFFGSEIIIQEFSTAPQTFNIQLNGSQQAVALFQGNADDLMAAFQAGNYNFRVNRLETGYTSERPLFKRKEKPSGDKQDQTGTGP